MPDNQGRIRLETANAQTASNGSVASPAGVITAGQWQHVAVVVRRGENATRLLVNGFPVAKGTIGPADLDNQSLDLHLGRVPGAGGFNGLIDNVVLYSRALDDAEIEALVEPGRQLANAPNMPPQDFRLELDEREFSGKLEQPAFVAVNLSAGQHRLKAHYAGAARIERIELTRIDGTPLAERFAAFQRRIPKLGVHLGLRRDCGSTLSRVGGIQEVPDLQPREFFFEGAINDSPARMSRKITSITWLACVRLAYGASTPMDATCRG